MIIESQNTFLYVPLKPAVTALHLNFTIQSVSTNCSKQFKHTNVGITMQQDELQVSAWVQLGQSVQWEYLCIKYVSFPLRSGETLSVNKSFGMMKIRMRQTELIRRVGN
jgi:hypothetical protein